MARLKFILPFLACLALSLSMLAQPNITKLEYFIDSDPGIGLGVDIPLTASPTQNLTINVPTGSLSEGFHSLTVRAQDQNNEWSIVENKAFFVGQSSTLASNNITKIEYFIDTDPGQGLGIDVPITSAINLDILENVPTGSLSEGFHTITFRAQDENGLWSHTENKAFYVSQSSTITINDITKIEYFIDTDPGRGLGVDVPVASATNLNILENIPTGALSEGFHVLSVRAQDVNGLWSLTENKIFYVNQSSTITINNITKIEYFIGADPGHGAGVDVPITSAPSFDFTENVPTSSLNEGFHMITVRAQDANGIWSHAENSLFFVSQSSTLVQNDITKIEYFIDADPGHGLGVDVPITAAPNFNFLENVPTSTLAEGFHTISVRALDQDLKWSLLESKPFYVSQSSTLSQNQITKLEYFIDADPGQGASIDIPITSGINLDILENIPTGSLSQGFHILTIRAQDQNGAWSLSEEKPFFVDRNRQIIAYEYAIDTDPGVGMANLQTIAPPQDSIDISLTVPTAALALGGHNLYVRILDENNFWSKTNIAPFSLCDGVLTSFTATTVCQGTTTDFSVSSSVQAGDTFSWDFDNDGLEDDNTFGNTTHTYPTAGIYTAFLRIDRAGCADSTTITVDVEPFPISNAGVDETICTDNTILSATPAGAGETGVWSLISGSGSFSNINDPSATLTGITTQSNQLRWTVTNDLIGCAAVDDVIITSNQPLANAGADQDICTDNTSLSATPANVGETGIWSIISGSGNFSDVNDPNAAFSGITSLNNQLRWTIINNTLGCTDSDDIVIISNQPISTSPLSNTVILGETISFDVQSLATINPGDNLTTTILTPPLKGTASVNSNGAIEYTPDNGTVGMDTVEFRLCNQCNNCVDSYAAADIQNNPPEISSQPGALGQSDSLLINLLDIISDLNNNLDLSSLRIVQQPISGALALIDANYNLVLDYTGVVFVGTDEVILEVCDVLGACANSTIFIEVNRPGESLPGPNPPVTVFNAISPNTADGKHDFLELENIDAYPNNSLFIFNRWGRKVYEVVGYDNDIVKFDGTGNTGGATDLPGGTYFYKLDLGDGTIMSGFLILKK